jgi:hypothetical protein
MDYMDNYKQVSSAFARTIFNISHRRVVERRMNEKMRALKAFDLLSDITGREDITNAEICRVAVKSLRQSCQLPEYACARIVLGDREYRTANYQETPWSSSVPVIVNDTVIGNIETGYIKERPGGEDIESIAVELTFLKEISEHLARILRLAAA